jgi:hypothetical protein
MRAERSAAASPSPYPHGPAASRHWCKGSLSRKRHTQLKRLLCQSHIKNTATGGWTCYLLLAAYFLFLITHELLSKDTKRYNDSPVKIRAVSQVLAQSLRPTTAVHVANRTCGWSMIAIDNLTGGETRITCAPGRAPFLLVLALEAATSTMQMALNGILFTLRYCGGCVAVYLRMIPALS